MEEWQIEKGSTAELGVKHGKQNKNKRLYMQWDHQDTGCQWLCVGLLISSRTSAPIVVFSLTGATFRAVPLYPVCYFMENERTLLYCHIYLACRFLSGQITMIPESKYDANCKVSVHRQSK